MSDEHPMWEQQPDEPLLWFQRFTTFRLMKPLHSIPKVYQKEYHVKPRKTTSKVPGDWYEMARVWQWEERAAAWDAYQDGQQEKLIIAERKKVLKSRYALMHKRVQLIDRKIQQLVEITDNPDEIWLDDVKAIGNGKDAERVDLVVFNDAAFRELREYLTDIADEMGERVKTTKQEVSGSVDITGAKELLRQRLEQLEQANNGEESR